MNKESDAIFSFQRDLREPIRGDRGATILGARNRPLETGNPDLLASPYTDEGMSSNLKFSFAAARNRLLTGGWAREVTIRELPAATKRPSHAGAGREVRREA